MRNIKCEFLNEILDVNTFLHKLKTNEEMRGFYTSKLPNDILCEFNKAINESINIACKYLHKVIIGKILYCKYSNKIIPYDRVLSGCITCNKEYESFGRGTATRNKKRKDVGLKISKALKGKSKSKEHKEKMSKRLKSLDFKKKVLENAGVIFNDVNLTKKYAEFYSNQRQGFEYKLNYCKKTIKDKRYHEQLNFNDNIDSLNNEQVLSLFSEIMSVKSSIAMKNNPTMGMVMTHKLENLSFNSEKTIIVRSGMEKKIANFLEKNKINWEYETEIIDYFFEFKRKYIVDFVIYINNKRILLEIKGSFRLNDIEKNKAKINSAIDLYGEIILYQGEKIYDINDLLKFKVNVKDDFKFKNAY